MNELRDLFQKYEAVVFFDTETTGLDAKTSQIIELAAIRITQVADGSLHTADSADMFIKLPEGQHLPEKIIELTGITDEKLAAEGIPAGNAAAAFANMIFSSPKMLLVAHNAQFDLLFIWELFKQFTDECGDILAPCDYLDSLTVYKDRGPTLTSWRTRSQPTSWRARCKTPTGRSTTFWHCTRYARPWTQNGPTCPLI